MAVGPRDYTEPTKKALFTLSMGQCYAPKCPERVIRMADDIPIVLTEIAHINAASQNGPRWRSDMTDDDRRSFDNLILLCTYHHQLVDKRPTGDSFKSATLRLWKKKREEGLSPALRDLTEDDLKVLLTENLRHIIGETKHELLVAIRTVEGVAAESASMLKVLVEQTFSRPYLDSDLVESLAESTRVLQTLPDHTPTLRESAQSLQILPDYGPLLRDFSSPLMNLPDYVPMLRNATENIPLIPDYALILRSVTDEVARIPNYADGLRRAVSQLDEAASEVSATLAHARELANVLQSIAGLEGKVRALSRMSDIAARNAEILEQASEAATQIKVPDRFTYIRNGAIGGAIAAILVIATVWYLIAGPIGTQ